jgi:hypothetical protein
LNGLNDEREGMRRCLTSASAPASAKAHEPTIRTFEGRGEELDAENLEARLFKLYGKRRQRQLHELREYQIRQKMFFWGNCTSMTDPAAARHAAAVPSLKNISPIASTGTDG